jgi:hypothetical protein
VGVCYRYLYITCIWFASENLWTLVGAGRLARWDYDLDIRLFTSNFFEKE